jgi:protein-L-isoaspartate O-methyltransferase
MTTTENLWQTRAARLADQLVQSGDIRDPRWAAAIASIPRHVLVPNAYRQQPDGSWSELGDNPELIYSPTTLVTDIEDGLAVSSSTKPDLMVRMLETLDVHDDDRVLEIGTGVRHEVARCK